MSEERCSCDDDSFRASFGDDVVAVEIGGVWYDKTDDLAPMPDGMPGIVFKRREPTE